MKVCHILREKAKMTDNSFMLSEVQSAVYIEIFVFLEGSNIDKMTSHGSYVAARREPLRCRKGQQIGKIVRLMQYNRLVRLSFNH